MIVVDTNIIGSLYLSSERSPQAEAALRKDPHWVAPLLWRSEFRSVLAQHIHNRIFPLEDAQRILEAAMTLMRGREYEPASHQVLSLAGGSTCSAYDCEFVALAQDLGIALVTLDRQVLEQFPVTALSLEAFIAMVE